MVDPAWLQFSFPTRWHYDVLRALEYFRAVAIRRTPRLAEAMTVPVQAAAGRQLAAGEHHPRRGPFALEDGDGRPSRWNTLRALGSCPAAQLTARRRVPVIPERSEGFCSCAGGRILRTISMTCTSFGA